jgi:hypothetical protein
MTGELRTTRLAVRRTLAALVGRCVLSELVSRGRKISASSNLGISKAQVDPLGRQTTGDRRELHLLLYLEPQVSSLRSSHKKGRESELIISPTQLLSCGGRERRVPLTSKEDSENVVGIAPMALPLDLAMAVGSLAKSRRANGKYSGSPVSERYLADWRLVAVCLWCSA